ncbi:MAG: hypothetical protein ACSLE1_08125 [Sphingobium sp.]
MRSLSYLVTFAALSLPYAPAQANGPTMKLVAQTFVERISTDGNGRERRMLMAPQQVGRGDRLVFVVRYRNEGTAPVGSFAVTNPVPPAVRIDPAQSGMQVSVDQGRNWGRLDSLFIPTPLGGVRRATPDDITHIRWMVPQPVLPGSEGQISYRATVR